MNPAALGFCVASLTPVPLLAMGVFVGGFWPWIALFYLTIFTFAMDEVIAVAAPDQSGDREFPASDGLLVVLAVSHFAILALVVAGFGHRSGGGFALGQGVALFLAAGLFFGQVGNSNAHELIHHGNRFLHRLGKWVYVSMLFGHHASAHRLVHHPYVASERDPNSARLGESYYGFARRAWIGSFRAGLLAENARMERRSRWRHPYYGYFAGAVAALAIAGLIGGAGGLVAFVGLAIYAQSQLLVSDYVQHYGLRRRQLANGKPEEVSTTHSWNAPHRFSAHLMLNAPHHSDHHTHPCRPFAKLALPTPDKAPTLPYSLPAMSVLALFPPLWRRVMDPRVAHWQTAPLNADAASRRLRRWPVTGAGSCTRFLASWRA